MNINLIGCDLTESLTKHEMAAFGFESYYYYYVSEKLLKSIDNTWKEFIL